MFLQINHANVNKFDSRILRLQNLRVLNLENNNLTALPEVLGKSLINLAELHLGKNRLGERRDWRWIISENLSKKLKLLDLSSNLVSTLFVSPKLSYEYKQSEYLSGSDSTINCISWFMFNFFVRT